MADNPMASLDKPKHGTPDSKDIKDDDLKLLISPLTHETDPGSVRDLAIVLFLADTGCRSGGIRTLRPTDVDLEKRHAVVREKGDQVRTVAFTSYTQNALIEWMKIRPKEAPTFFCGFYGKHFGKPLKETAINQMLERRARKAKINGPFNPHSFRHRAVKKMLTTGMSAGVVSASVGHRNVNTTISAYEHLEEADRFQAHESQGPLANLMSWLQNNTGETKE